ncbi:multisubunit Na+/H+ antiporter MnhB subunit [Bacillus mesophilus]|nr:multisubunit Na+/H+ antiporter MnhB subunit [Bacillus mesophilus]
MFIILTLALLIITIGLLKFFSVKRPLAITLFVGLVISTISTISLWLNYKASFGEQDGISISNIISYWIITDGTQWTQELFMDYFIYALIVNILFTLLVIITFFANKRTIAA